MLSWVLTQNRRRGEKAELQMGVTPPISKDYYNPQSAQRKIWAALL